VIVGNLLFGSLATFTDFTLGRLVSGVDFDRKRLSDAGEFTACLCPSTVGFYY
jgi:hypothetical protein